jgi:predicted ribosome-associated RNA-binding protein Tma20
MPSRFEIDYADPAIEWEPLVDEVFGELTSSFIEMPKGDGFVEYGTFEKGYQTLKRHTDAFAAVTSDTVLAAVRETPIAFIVFRCILGFTPPEWAYMTSEKTGVAVDQGAARSIDRRIRLTPLTPMNEGTGVTGQRIRAMIEAGVKTVSEGAGIVPPGIVHRMDKADTAKGIGSLQSIADLGVPYPVLLYERFLGRPFATHRDSVSELVGEVVEVAIKNVLSDAKISFRETKRAERIPGFDQTPDFIIPDEFTPVALIEAKLTEDDGTARDKVARVQRLRTLRDEDGKDYDVIACIAGRGFKVRREDMRRMLQATDGKVFTLATMHLLIEHTRIREYRVR